MPTDYCKKHKHAYPRSGRCRYCAGLRQLTPTQEQADYEAKVAATEVAGPVEVLAMVLHTAGHKALKEADDDESYYTALAQAAMDHTGITAIEHVKPLIPRLANAGRVASNSAVRYEHLDKEGQAREEAYILAVLRAAALALDVDVDVDVDEEEDDDEEDDHGQTEEPRCLRCGYIMGTFTGKPCPSAPPGHHKVTCRAAKVPTAPTDPTEGFLAKAQAATVKKVAGIVQEILNKPPDPAEDGPLCPICDKEGWTPGVECGACRITSPAVVDPEPVDWDNEPEPRVTKTPEDGPALARVPYDTALATLTADAAVMDRLSPHQIRLVCNALARTQPAPVKGHPPCDEHPAELATGHRVTTYTVYHRTCAKCDAPVLPTQHDIKGEGDTQP